MDKNIIDSLLENKFDSRVPKEEKNKIDGNISIKKKINLELAKISRRGIDKKKAIVNCK